MWTSEWEEILFRIERRISRGTKDVRVRAACVI
jgi:hypothetical protein